MNQDETYAAIKNAFKKLRKYGLICRMRHLCCMSCASSDLGQKCDERNKDGAVYFHRQDYDGFFGDANDRWGRSYRRYNPNHESTLMIRFFSATEDKDNSKVTTKDVGELAYVALEDEGLDLEWDGSPHHCISVIANRKVEEETVAA